jgi:hypothetical protein
MPRLRVVPIITRTGWAVAIVAVFPVGAMMYRRYGKGPQRFV